MTPCNKIMREILFQAGYDGDLCDDDSVESAWSNEEDWADEDGIRDCVDEFRCSGIPTDLPAPTSRHYESKSVARELMDGTWVGWTYWYGGGKHGEPGAVPWMEHAYDVACVEEEKLVVVRTFTKV
jgi:hypothetical protein